MLGHGASAGVKAVGLLMDIGFESYSESVGLELNLPALTNAQLAERYRSLDWVEEPGVASARLIDEGMAPKYERMLVEKELVRRLFHVTSVAEASRPGSVADVLLEDFESVRSDKRGIRRLFSGILTIEAPLIRASINFLRNIDDPQEVASIAIRRMIKPHQIGEDNTARIACMMIEKAGEITKTAERGTGDAAPSAPR